MSKTLPVPTNSDYVFKRIFGDERNIDSLHAFGSMTLTTKYPSVIL